MRFILLILALFLFSNESSASCLVQPIEGQPTGTECSDQGEAVQWTASRVQAYISYQVSTAQVPANYICIGEPQINLANGSVRRDAVICGSTQMYAIFSASFIVGSTCAARPAITGQPLNITAQTASTTCIGGCTYTYTFDATTGTRTTTGGTCATETFQSKCLLPKLWIANEGYCTPPQADTDADGHIDSQDAFPNDATEWEDTDNDGHGNVSDKFDNDAGEWQDSDNDGVGNNGDIKPNDATNGKDTTAGNGTEKDNTSVGGGNCATPPSSIGDAITGSIAWQTWNTRCELEKVNAKLQALTAVVVGDISNCNAGFSCTGNSAQCAQVYALRVKICPNQVEMIAKLESIKSAIEAQGGNSGGGSSGIDGNVSGMDSSDGTGGFTAGSGNVQEVTLDESQFDDSGFLGGSRQCPAMPVISVMGTTLDFNNQDVCLYFQIGAALVLLVASLGGLRIIGGA